MSGLFGVISSRDCSKTLFYGTDYHSHLGTEKAGMATFYSGRFYRIIHDISQAQFRSKFVDELSQIKGKIGIGVISDFAPQPILISSHFGDFAIVATGLLRNKETLIKEIKKHDGSFSEITNGEINSVEVAGKIIASQPNLMAGINYFFSRLRGSMSMLILTSKGIYAVRDYWGRSSLTMAHQGKTWAVASETCAFPNLGFKIKKELAPGEVLFLSKKGAVIQQKGQLKRKVCSFAWIYTGYPASTYEGISVERVRERSGANLAKRDKKEGLKVDLVAGIPDSGTAHAIGYAHQASIPFRRVLVKYTPSYGRSYMPPDQVMRDRIAKKKLIPIPSLIKGKKIVVCDDSIVRGTQLHNQVINRLWQYGAKEVHVRIACPPLMFHCLYFLSTKKDAELASRRAIKAVMKNKKIILDKFMDEKSHWYQKMVDYIANEMRVTSLKYQTLPDMIKAIGLSPRQLCCYCWRGKD